LTESYWWLGVVGFAGQIPTFFLAPVAGVLVDRTNRHRLLVLTQTLAMVQAFIVAGLALAGVIEVWHILLMSVLLGVVNAFDMTVRQAFMVDLVTGQEDLANAIALNSTMVNGTRLVGPAVAGLLLAWTSAGVCFLVNGLSYLAVLAGLFAMRVPFRQRTEPPAAAWPELREGLAYALGFGPIRSLLLLLALVGLMGMSYSVLLPVFAADYVGGGPYTLGYLSAASGIGALVAAVHLAARQSVLGLGKWIAAAPALFGSGLVVFSASRVWWLSCLALVIAGFGMMTHLAASNTILQTIVEDDKRGRVMSLYTMAFMGTVPLGSLLTGFVAERIGAAETVRIGALACIGGSIVFAFQLRGLRAQIRPIYIVKGIIPEVNKGIETASELVVAEKKG
jgi:MFS family permease